MPQNKRAALLPSDTTARFWFLVTVIALSSLSIGQFFPKHVLVFGNGYDINEMQCMVASFTLVLLIAAAVYLLKPQLSRRAFAKKTYTIDDSNFIKRVSALSSACGISLPKVTRDSAVGNLEAITFGLPFKRQILIGRGLQFASTKGTMAAHVRLCHEMAHLANKDVDMAMFAHSYILAFVSFLTCLIVYQAQGMVYFWLNHRELPILSVTADLISNVYGTYLLWTFIAILIYKSFLRSREYYADDRASDLCGRDVIYNHIAMASGKAKNHAFITLRYSEPLSSHPVAAKRAQMLRTPSYVGFPDRTDMFFFSYAISAASDLLHPLELINTSIIGLGAMPQDIISIYNMIIKSDIYHLFIIVLLYTILPAGLFWVAFTLVTRRIQQTAIDEVSNSAIFLRIIKDMATIGVGSLLGSAISPSYASNFIYSRNMEINYFECLMFALDLSIAYGLFHLLFLIPTCQMIRGTRRVRVHTRQWILCYILMACSFIQIVVGLVVILEGVWVSGAVQLAYGVLLWFLVFVYAIFISGGLKNVGASKLAPWIDNAS